jgi:desulfoferrodoxin (superoxide reductase-like protein)
MVEPQTEFHSKSAKIQNFHKLWKSSITRNSHSNSIEFHINFLQMHLKSLSFITNFALDHLAELSKVVEPQTEFDSISAKIRNFHKLWKSSITRNSHSNSIEFQSVLL